MQSSSLISQKILINNVNLYVEDTGGEGQSVILIHGWPLSGASWNHQIDPLTAAGFRVITYDRRGFGNSDKPSDGYDYDTFTKDLAELISELDLQDVSLVGFSMGGGEVARYIGTYGEERIKNVVLAAAIPPMLLKTASNPDGPLDEAAANEMKTALTENPQEFYDEFTKKFFSEHADGNVLVSEKERQSALALAHMADHKASIAAMEAFAMTDFRKDLEKITVPTLVLHGDADGTVPFLGSGARTHKAIEHSELHVIVGGPHGINVSHVDEFNAALIKFLKQI